MEALFRSKFQFYLTPKHNGICHLFSNGPHQMVFKDTNAASFCHSVISCMEKSLPQLVAENYKSVKQPGDESSDTQLLGYLFLNHPIGLIPSDLQ